MEVYSEPDSLGTELSHLRRLDSQSRGLKFHNPGAGCVEAKHEYDYIVVGVHMLFNPSQSTAIAPVPYYQSEQTASLAVATR